MSANDAAIPDCTPHTHLQRKKQTLTLISQVRLSAVANQKTSVKEFQLSLRQDNLELNSIQRQCNSDSLSSKTSPVLVVLFLAKKLNTILIGCK